MKNSRNCAALCTILIVSGCVSNPKRPLVPMCGSAGDCLEGDTETMENPSTLICTIPSGYSRYENYIDELELRIRNLERNCKKEE